MASYAFLKPICYLAKANIDTLKCGIVLLFSVTVHYFPDFVDIQSVAIMGLKRLLFVPIVFGRN